MVVPKRSRLANASRDLLYFVAQWSLLLLFGGFGDIFPGAAAEVFSEDPVKGPQGLKSTFKSAFGNTFLAFLHILETATAERVVFIGKL